MPPTPSVPGPRPTTFHWNTYSDSDCTGDPHTLFTITQFSVSVDGYMQCANYDGASEGQWKLLTCDPSTHSATLQAYDNQFTCTGGTVGGGIKESVDTWADLFAGHCVKSPPLNSRRRRLRAATNATAPAAERSRDYVMLNQAIPPDDLPSCVA